VTTATSPSVSLGEALERFDAEAQPGTVHTGRYQCKYISWGEGPPLIFIHGLADNLRSFVLPMTLLSKQFRCIAYNQPRSQGDGARLKGYRHEHLADDLFALMDHLGLEQANLFGSSFGSTTAMRAMHARPQRVSRAILQGAFAYRPLARQQWWLAWFARYWLGRLKHLPFHMKAVKKSHYPPFEGRDPQQWRFFLEQTGSPPIKAVAHWALLLHQTDVRGLLPEINQPTLLLCGDRDPLVPFPFQMYLFDHLPKGVMFQIENCGHFPMFSNPEAVADATRKFLQSPICQLSSVPCP
jgi:pimeloyl-ACP methyl ester carboxylesterase